jgi:hypothetical protein
MFGRAAAAACALSTLCAAYARAEVVMLDCKPQNPQIRLVVLLDLSKMRVISAEESGGPIAGEKFNGDVPFTEAGTEINWSMTDKTGKVFDFVVNRFTLTLGFGRRGADIPVLPDYGCRLLRKKL